MIFKMDPELLIQMATTAKASVDNITTGVNTAYLITEHNDWNCIERNQINELVYQIKKYLKELEEDIVNFSHNLSLASEKYKEIENEWVISMGGVDSAIASQIAINSTDVSSLSGDVFSGIFKESLSVGNTDAYSSYTANSFDKTLKVCSFADIDLNSDN